MSKITRRTLCAGIALGCAMATLATGNVALAQAEQYPNHTVKLIVPFPPGGTSDIMGRLIADELGRQLGQPFVVENKAGAGGSIGAAEAARATPDGYTLVLSGIGSNAIVHGYTPKPSYDSKKDFVHISQLAIGANVLVVNPAFPAKTFEEFIAYAKANPGKFNYGQVNASSGHLASEYLKQVADIDIVGIPYRGGAPAMNDVLANQIPGMFTNHDAAYPHVKAGKLRALAITSAERNPLYPDVPTVAESGYPGFSAVSWTGLSAPAGTPQPIIDRLETAMRQAFSKPDTKAKLEDLGFVVVASTSQEYTAFVAKEIDHWLEVIKTAGIQFD